MFFIFVFFSPFYLTLYTFFLLFYVIFFFFFVLNSNVPCALVVENSFRQDGADDLFSTSNYESALNYKKNVHVGLKRFSWMRHIRKSICNAFIDFNSIARYLS